MHAVTVTGNWFLLARRTTIKRTTSIYVWNSRTISMKH